MTVTKLTEEEKRLLKSYHDKSLNVLVITKEACEDLKKLFQRFEGASGETYSLIVEKRSKVVPWETLMVEKRIR